MNITHMIQLIQSLGVMQNQKLIKHKQLNSKVPQLDQWSQICHLLSQKQ